MAVKIKCLKTNGKHFNWCWEGNLQYHISHHQGAEISSIFEIFCLKKPKKNKIKRKQAQAVIIRKAELMQSRENQWNKKFCYLNKSIKLLIPKQNWHEGNKRQMISIRDATGVATDSSRFQGNPTNNSAVLICPFTSMLQLFQNKKRPSLNECNINDSNSLTSIRESEPTV